MKANELEAFIEKKQKVSDRNYRMYQETGEPRYDRERRNADDLIEIANQALSAADDHQMIGIYRCELSHIGGRAQELLLEYDETKVKEFLRSVVNDAIRRGLVRDLRISS